MCRGEDRFGSAAQRLRSNPCTAKDVINVMPGFRGRKMNPVTADIGRLIDRWLFLQRQLSWVDLMLYNRFSATNWAFKAYLLYHQQIRID